MNELSKIKDYGQFKEALGTELSNQAAGFVRTGYLLKRARDTDILKDSGYATVAEFALAEYGLSKDVVSRYIAINDRYSQEGYSEYLQEQFEGYGVAKLQEMLTLPMEVVGMISMETTKREIQEIKKEIREEEKITDLEVLLEGRVPEQESMTLAQKVIYQYFYENRGEYLLLADVIRGNEGAEKVMDVLAPSGAALKSVRIRGIGKFIISFRGTDEDIEMVNVRNNEKTVVTWQQFLSDLAFVFAGNAGKKEWEEVYGEPFEVEKEEPKKKTEVAPVQPEKKGKKEPESETAPEEKVQETKEEDVQIPGQTNLEYDFAAMNQPEEQARENTIRGYRAAVANNLNNLRRLWEGEDENKLDLMISIARDLKWRLEQLKEAEE